MTTRAVAWLALAVSALKICAGSNQLGPVAALPDVFDAPDTADRISDTYMLEAFVWRDSQPLIITGEA